MKLEVTGKSGAAIAAPAPIVAPAVAAPVITPSPVLEQPVKLEPKSVAVDPRALPGIPVDGLDPILEAAVNSQPVLPPKPAKDATAKPEPETKTKFVSATKKVAAAGANWKTYLMGFASVVVMTGVAVLSQNKFKPSGDFNGSNPGPSSPGPSAGPATDPGNFDGFLR